MIARTVERHSDRSGNYFIAAGEAYGRQIIAEGLTREEAIKRWTQCAADRQAELMALDHSAPACNLVMALINGGRA